MNTHLIDACARLRAEAATDNVATVTDKVIALTPLLKDVKAGERLACVQVLEETLAILKQRQAGQ